MLNGLWKLFWEQKNMSTLTEIEELTLEYVQEIGKKWIDHLIQTMPAEDVMKKYDSETRLRGLRPEERLNGLNADQRFAGLSTEELKKPKDKLKDL